MPQERSATKVSLIGLYRPIQLESPRTAVKILSPDERVFSVSSSLADCPTCLNGGPGNVRIENNMGKSVQNEERRCKQSHADQGIGGSEQCFRGVELVEISGQFRLRVSL